MHLHHRIAGTPEGVFTIEAHLHGGTIGRAAYQLCPVCWRRLVCKVNAYDPYAGFGLDTLLIDACVAVL